MIKALSTCAIVGIASLLGAPASAEPDIGGKNIGGKRGPVPIAAADLPEPASGQLRVLLKDAFTGFDQDEDRWSTEIDYSDEVKTASDLNASKRGEVWQRATSATFERRFGHDAFQPVFGLGIGESDPNNLDDDGVAVQALIGSAIQLSDRVGATLRYGLGLNGVSSNDRRGDSLQFGLKIDLN